MTDQRSVSFRKITIQNFAALLLISFIFLASCSRLEKSAPPPISKVRTVTGNQEKFGEPFGIAVKGADVFFSDGETGKIQRVSNNQTFTVVTDKLHTPSAIAFDKYGDLIVADSGTHTIKRVKIESGAIELIAGVENQKGYADGEAAAALFHAPIGLAVLDDRIFVADTYNDKIRVIENGRVSTLAGGGRGFADGVGGDTKFDTPCGLAIWKNKLVVADAGNQRIRTVEMNGITRTLAGSGAADSNDGYLYQAGFVEPLAVSVDSFGAIYVADGNSIRVIGKRFFPLVETVTNQQRGFADGALRFSRFNRPSGLAFDEAGNLFVADAENQSIRVLTGAEIGAEITEETSEKMRVSPQEFRQLAAPRWTYNPPEQRREIAGTLGEIRGDRKDENAQVWFHNGLDIVGGYGEIARFVRSEKVLQPIAAENFATLRELIRMPTLGYIHIRLGRDKDDKLFNDSRFVFSFDETTRRIKDVRVPRGAKFEAGEAIGTLNSMNHVHLVAGRSGAEMNALDALVLPGVSDSIAPIIQQVSLFDENWQPIGETRQPNSRIKLDQKTRIVVRAHDRMDGNAERRRLGVYRIGYQVLREDLSPLSDVNWTISFDRMPEAEAAPFVYAVGSKSGATGETIFDYIASNRVSGDSFQEDFFDAANLENGNYILRVFAADFFGNQISKDIIFVR